MNIKLDASVVLSLALGCLASSAVASVKYAPEYTNNWFTVEISGLDDGVITTGEAGVGGAWTQAANGGAVVDKATGSIALDTDVENPLTYNSASTYSNISRIVTKLTLTQSSELPAVNTLPQGVKTALCVCTNASDAASWFALVNGAWRELTTAEAPAVGHDYEIILDSDSVNGAIRYFAKDLEADQIGYTPLTDGWVANQGSQSHIENVSFVGSTTIKDSIAGIDVLPGYAYDGKVYESFENVVQQNPAIAQSDNVSIPITTVGAEVVANVNMSVEWINDNIVSTSEEGWAATAASKFDTVPEGGNDMKYWQSYVLGLDPKDPASKPIVQPVQDASSDKVSFALGNVDPAANSGVGVQYRVGEYEAPGSETPIAGKEGEFVNAGENATADLPGSGAKYYKLEVKFN